MVETGSTLVSHSFLCRDTRDSPLPLCTRALVRLSMVTRHRGCFPTSPLTQSVARELRSWWQSSSSSLTSGLNIQASNGVVDIWRSLTNTNKLHAETRSPSEPRTLLLERPHEPTVHLQSTGHDRWWVWMQWHPSRCLKE